ncbi:flagellar L-ring protein FlgH [Pseudothermotoga hypogea DSM 11164 = NBRC 106472]|uniref:Flagellar L-ring protein FlgH n=3 Tax=Pseudothermotoga TaxID=1643951 RepID=A0A0X1KQL9_9THEM|nr:flagellar basal body L-ring protein FlgH [Pseudothermotoga hypogea]AJC73608.1 flagellar L-ring protein FlgH [Pseudothermotoga hypogea DSM 11164 = NBRC 106472]MBC7122533.1 flagellar basal body L-ring protein FlgH [Pseudothermotoga sp.]
MRRFLIFALMLFTAIILATSLWNSSTNTQFRYIISDRKASRVGDIVTIVVRESPQFSTSLSTESLEKALMNLITGTVKGITNFDLSKFIPINNNTNIDRSAKTSTNVIMTMSAVVVAIENGNFVIEGNRQLKVGNQLSEVTIRGTVRPDDIAANNTIDSSKIANCQIWVNGQLVFRQKPDEESWLDAFLSAIARFLL